MAAATSMLAAGAAIQGSNSMVSSYNQSRALREQGNYQRAMGDMNARYMEIQEKDALRRGEKEANAHQKDVKRLVGSQRAALAAQGIEINDDSALDIQADTAAMGAEDAMTIRNNAWREAMGFKIQAVNTRYAGQMAQMGAMAQAKSTLLTGGMQALGSGMSAVGHAQGGSVSKPTTNLSGGSSAVARADRTSDYWTS